ncbi:MAG: hypothetical protein IT158_21695 [Bryobacterales bacterium]|nr:hypothetical protein [Bryobacterales bacterium]
MTPKLRGWLLIAVVVAVCGAAVYLLAVYRSRTATETARLLRRLPADDALLLAVDFRAIRESGVLSALAESKVAEEPEYRRFVEATGFDYKQDLDTALAAFRSGETFFLLRGRFDWPSLSAYVKAQGGSCHNSLCRMQGSTPARQISFFPVHREVMALAVSRDSWAVSRLLSETGGGPAAAPSQPVWMRIPDSLLRDSGRWPTGTRLFAAALQNAEQVEISVAPAGNRLEARLEVDCRSPGDAEKLHNQLQGLTEVLRAMLDKAKQQPNPRDLTGVLSAGAFSRENDRVIGRWPVEQAFLEAIAAP